VDFSHYWQLLTQGVRDNIVAGIILAVLGTGVSVTWLVFRKSIGAAWRRLLGRGSAAVEPKQVQSESPLRVQHEHTFKLDPAQAAAPLTFTVAPSALVEGAPEAGVSPATTHTPASPPARARLAAVPSLRVVAFVARRDAEGNDILKCLREELQPGRRQLCVLWGAGGVGKTTLAAEAANALADSYDGRVVWSSPLGRADYTRATLLDDIAAQLGHAELRQLAPEPKAEAVRALLAEAPALVVLDNFETVGAQGQAAKAEQHAEAEQQACAAFLRAAPCAALVTTRQKVADAHNVKVDAMEIGEARAYLKLLIAETNEAETFAALDPDRIIETAARNPLVLQWVVAQIDGAQDPEEVFRDLAQGTGDAAERVFDRSFNLPQLGDDGRAALLALSLFTPDAARAAIAEVAGFAADTPRLNAALKHLADLWLVKTAHAGKRLALEALTRQLAKARLQRDPHAADFRQRYVAHFLRHAEAHDQPTPEAYDALEAELDNLLAAFDVAEGLRDWESVQRLAWALSISVTGVLSVRGYWDEAIRRGEQGARAAEAAGDEAAAVKLAGDAASVRLLRGEYEAARRAYERALAVLRRRGDERNVAVFLHQLGRVAQDRGEPAEARRLYEESLEINKKLGNQRGVASTVSQLGIVHYALGELAESKAKHEESLAIRRKLGDQQGIAIDLHQLAMLAQDRGELTEARRLYGESLEIEKRLGNQGGVAISLHTLGLLAEEEGDKAEAARLLREALSIFERLKSPYAEVARRVLARVEGRAG
jgi:tetratricopeptide (TPR) repeat protein